MTKRALTLMTIGLGLALTTTGLKATPTCTATGFVRDGINLTALMINPAFVSGTVNAAGCNIGVYFAPGSTGEIKNADIAGANYFGVVADGAAGSTAVDILNSSIHDIGEYPLNGTQHGVAIYYAAFSSDGSATGKVSGNHVFRYQKGGIVVNGEGSNVIVSNNEVNGEGPVGYIAQNGIQFGWGSGGSAMKNTITGHSYTGTSTMSCGILIYGGEYYGAPLTKNIQVVQNTVTGNDVGVYLGNYNALGNAPDEQTNIKVVNNTISNNALTNHYGSVGYQAGIADVGNNDKMINNKISGAGYDPSQYPSAWVFLIDADPSFTNRAKIHANK
jgi:hypothetical protein